MDHARRSGRGWSTSPGPDAGRGRRPDSTANLIMKNTNHPLIHLKLRLVAGIALAALLCSCASTSVRQTWKSPDSHGPVGKTAVLAIAERGLLRQGFENRFVAQLAQGGTAALTTFDLMPLAQIKQDKRAAAERFTAGGASSVLILRLVDKTSSYREIRPGSERYAAVLTGYETIGWYDYYSVGRSEGVV